MEDTAYRQAAHLHTGVTITLAMPHRDTSPLAPPDLIDVAVAEGTRGDMFAHVFLWPVVTIGAFALFGSPINRTCQVGGVSQGMAVVHTRARTSVLFSSPINSSTSGPCQSGGGGWGWWVVCEGLLSPKGFWRMQLPHRQDMPCRREDIWAWW